MTGNASSSALPVLLSCRWVAKDKEENRTNNRTSCIPLLTFQPGFPEDRIRNVDQLLYRMLTDAMRSKQYVRDVFEETFGRGLTMAYTETAPTGWYDGTTELDTLTRLSIAFSEGFGKRRWRQAKASNEREAIPAVAWGIAGTCGSIWKRTATGCRLKLSDITFAPLSTLSCLSTLLSSFGRWSTLWRTRMPFHPQWAIQERDGQPSPPELYFDFTGETRGSSRDLAAACVRRDMEMTQRFIAANLSLRQLDAYVQRMRADPSASRSSSSVIPCRVNAGGRITCKALLLLRDDERTENTLDVGPVWTKTGYAIR